MLKARSATEYHTFENIPPHFLFMDLTAHRVNGGMLSVFAGQRVVVVGQVLSQDGSMAMLQCSDNAQVQIQMSPGSQYNSQYVEVVGVADAAGSALVREERCCDMGNAFDLANYDAMVGLANGKYKHLFSA